MVKIATAILILFLQGCGPSEHDVRTGHSNDSDSVGDSEDSSKNLSEDSQAKSFKDALNMAGHQAEGLCRNAHQGTFVKKKSICAGGFQACQVTCDCGEEWSLDEENVTECPEDFELVAPLQCPNSAPADVITVHSSENTEHKRLCIPGLNFLNISYCENDFQTEFPIVAADLTAHCESVCRLKAQKWVTGECQWSSPF